MLCTEGTIRGGSYSSCARIETGGVRSGRLRSSPTARQGYWPGLGGSENGLDEVDFGLTPFFFETESMSSRPAASFGGVGMGIGPVGVSVR